MAEHDKKSSAGPDRTVLHGDDRFPKAFGKDYVRADERSFEELLCFLVDFAKGIKYFEEVKSKDKRQRDTGREAGNWSPLLLHDEVVIMAQIICYDVDSLEARFNRLPQKPIENRLKVTCPLVLTLFEWYNLLISGTDNVLDTSDDDTWRNALITEFGHVRRDNVFQKLCEKKKYYPDDYKGIDFEECFHKYIRCLKNLKAFCTKHIQAAICSGKHDPAVGLLFAFLKMYQTSQQQLNRFTPNHLKFYYEECLKSVPRPGKANASHLLFATASKEPIVIEKGTGFTADSNDAGMKYAADADLTVSNTEIESMFTLSFEQNKLVCPANRYGWTTGSYLRRLPPTAHTYQPAAFQTPWALFGSRRMAEKTRDIEAAEIGFSIASPVLNMKEGMRTVTLKIRYRNRGVDQLKQIREYCTKEFKDIHDYLNDAFHISFTTEDGWYKTTTFSITDKAQDNDKGNDTGCLAIQVTLSPLVKPVISYDESIHGGGYEAHAPIMQVILNPQANPYMYSILQPMEPECIDIDVEVHDATNLVLSNQNGPLDTSNTFLPFGPVPTKDSFLVLGSYEIATKAITELSFKMAWSNLPNDSGGFEAYYRDYDNGVSNNSFLVDLSCLQDGTWKTFDEKAVNTHLLFQSDGGPGLSQTSEFKIVSPYLLTPIRKQLQEAEYSYDSHAKEGFLKISFSRESAMFGFKDYPKILNQVLSENAKRKKKKPQPNLPYAPSISRVSLSYKARARIQPSFHQESGDRIVTEMLFQKDPFTLRQVYPHSLQSASYLLPQYESGGYLHLKVTTGSLPKRITFLFLLENDSTFDTKPREDNVAWSYRDNGSWKELSKEFIIRDDTKGFLKTGVIEIDLSSHALQHLLKHENMLWLRIHAKEQAYSYCSCYGVYPHGLKVSRTDVPVNVSPAKQPSGQLKPAKSLPGISRVVHVDGYFGGRNPETTEQMNIRVSERLRHKNRAWIPWDYERLIIEEFPELAFVKCFPGMRSATTSRKYKKPGYVMIVAMPHLEQSSSQINYCPRLNVAMLERIHTFICKHTSSFIQGKYVEVRNPAYDRIMIKCKVKFDNSENRGDCELRFNSDLNAYISPWHKDGDSRKFGWNIRRSDLLAYLQDRPYVKFVTGLSIIRISMPDSPHHEFNHAPGEAGSGCNTTYTFFDTADTAYSPKMSNMAGPSFPWSMAVPAERHLITVIDANTELEPQEQNTTGIKELEIETSFIIGNTKSHG